MLNTNLTEGRGINKGTPVLIDDEIFIYLGFDEINKKHLFNNEKQEEKILISLRDCFKASLKYQRKYLKSK